MLLRRSRKNKAVALALRADADRLRDARLWDAAAQIYKSYLELRPRGAGIWVQLGHCQKEAGLLEAADASYGRAAALAPENADVWLQIGHLRKRQGRLPEAAAHYAKALAKDPALTPARLELEQFGFGPSDIASLIAAPDSAEAAQRLAELHGRSPARSGSAIEERLRELGDRIEALAAELDNQAERIEEICARLDALEERVSTQSGQIEGLPEVRMSVKALGFAMKRQEGRIAAAAEKLAALQARLDRPPPGAPERAEPATAVQPASSAPAWPASLNGAAAAGPDGDRPA
jgi:tetratricopeptide (TPR) repeat protein